MTTKPAIDMIVRGADKLVGQVEMPPNHRVTRRGTAAISLCDEIIATSSSSNTAEPPPHLSMRSTMRLKTKGQSTTGKMQFGWPRLCVQSITPFTRLILRVPIAVRPPTQWSTGWLNARLHFKPKWTFLDDMIFH